MIGKNTVLIIGGGLAGLVAAIHLSKNGIAVTVIEKNEFPRHKVCGEYISNEVLTYFESLGIDIQSFHPAKIDALCFSLQSGHTIHKKLPLGGFGISRHTLDCYLYTKAREMGCLFKKETVTKVTFTENLFTVETDNEIYEAAIVLGAFGKRSNIDGFLQRNFIKKKSNWLGVKAHYKLKFPHNTVGLHHFKGGYCGISNVEDGKVNVCYLANYETFKKYKSIADYQEKVLFKNPILKQLFTNATLLFDKPLTISQVSFDKKLAVENHLLMIGDAAGLIHPLCGNGMAMAIHSAKLASESCIKFLDKKQNRTEMENEYTYNWNFNFKKRLRTGRLLGRLLQKEKLATFVLQFLIIFPLLLTAIIKKTHGNPI